MLPAMCCHIDQLDRAAGGTEGGGFDSGQAAHERDDTPIVTCIGLYVEQPDTGRAAHFIRDGGDHLPTPPLTEIRNTLHELLAHASPREKCPLFSVRLESSPRVACAHARRGVRPEEAPAAAANTHGTAAHARDERSSR